MSTHNFFSKQLDQLKKRGKEVAEWSHAQKPLIMEKCREVGQWSLNQKPLADRLLRQGVSQVNGIIESRVRSLRNWTFGLILGGAFAYGLGRSLPGLLAAHFSSKSPGSSPTPAEKTE